MIRKLLLSVIVASMAFTLIANAQSTDGEQKDWLTKSYQPVKDSTLAPFYRIVTYVKGLPIGPFVDYYRQGSVHRRGTFVRHDTKSYIEGTVDVYRENGALEVRETYVRGLRSGPYTRYAPHGMVSLSGEFDDDRRSGEWTTYHASGSVKSRGAYLDGQKDGEWRSYDEAGVLIESVVFSMGAQVDWVFLLAESEKALDADRTAEALRFLELARKSLPSSFSPASMPYARVHKVRTLIAMSTNNDEIAVRHFDTAVRICMTSDPRALRYRNDFILSVLYKIIPDINALTKDWKYANEKLVQRVATEITDVFNNDTSLSDDYAKQLIDYSSNINVVLRDTSLHTAAINWMMRHEDDPVLTSDSTICTNRVYMWSYLGNLSRFMGQRERYEMCMQQSIRMTNLLPTSTRSSLRARLDRDIALASLRDTIQPWPKRRQRFRNIIAQYNTPKDSSFCKCFSNAVIEGIINRDTSFLKETETQLVNVCGDSSDWSVFAIGARLYTELIARRCESARILNAKVQLRSDSLATRLRLFLNPLNSLCSSIDDTLALPVVPPVFTSATDTTIATLNDVLRTTQTSKGVVYARGLRSGASAEDLVEALLAADTVGSYTSSPTLVASYRALSARMKRIVATISNPRERARAIFRYLHDSVLTRYEENIRLREVFVSGTYNCNSAVALYGLLCEENNVPLTYFSSPGHVFCGVKEPDSTVYVELTAPVDGFDFQLVSDSVVKHLVMFKFVTPEEVEQLGRDSILRRYYAVDRMTDFTSVIATTMTNAIARLRESDPETLDFYEHVLGAITLSPPSAIFPVFMIPLALSMESQVIRERLPHDVIELARYRGSELGVSAGLLISIMQGLLNEVSPNLQSRYDQAVQVVWNRMPVDQRADSLRSVVKSLYAVSLALKALRNNAPDTAFAYLVKHPNALFDKHTAEILPIISEFVKQLEDGPEYIKILRVPDYFNATLTPKLREQALRISLEAHLQGQAVVNISDSTFAGNTRECLRLLRTSLKDTEALESFVWETRSNLIFRGRLDLVSDLIREATSAGLRPGYIREMHSLHQTMLANSKHPVATKRMNATMMFRLGSENGPITESLPSHTRDTRLSLGLHGLDPGQTFQLQIALDVPGFERNMFHEGRIGAEESTVILVRRLPTLRSKGKSVIVVFVDGKEILRRDIHVR